MKTAFAPGLPAGNRDCAAAARVLIIALVRLGCSWGGLVEGRGARWPRADANRPQVRVILIAVKGPANQQYAMIFDLDGVLIHSMPLHVLAWERYLRGLGIQVNNMERRMHGKRNAELVRDLISDTLSEEVVFGHGAAKERLFREMIVEAGVEKFRIPGLMEFLERHAEVPKAVGSNAEPANIDFVLDQLGLRRFFQIAVNGLQVSRPKPFSDIYLEAAKRLKMRPRDCIVFEDSPTGIEAARAAGMRVVGVETTPTEFQAVDLHIKDFLDPRLEAWLREQRAA